MSQILQNFAKFQKILLDNLVDFEKCCKTRIFLQKSVPIQPKTSNILPKFCQNWQLPYGSLGDGDVFAAAGRELLITGWISGNLTSRRAAAG